ncbi:hypothetical protein IEO70_11900 [Bacillus sp. AGMB 02131]|uniref:Yip1 domain-containing protein n=1 Tax=Peribacillus faecalis TaxID=2772559 RepID=A0A927CWS2_9BACI|nr:hypothetical protein [Peribacillus faecalis]MBD3109063.1 hypothetical protein [Peribacillus faecalis]
MNLPVRPLKGIMKPGIYIDQLKLAENCSQYKRYIFILLAISIILYALNAFLGIGTESLSKELIGAEMETWIARSQLFLVGSTLSGALVACIFLFLSSIYYWSFLQADYQRIVIAQMSIFILFLVEKALQIPLYIWLDVGDISNILSFGIIAQYISDSQILAHFLSQITLFRVGMLVMSYYYLKELSEVSRRTLLIVIGFLFLFFWIASGLLSYIKIGVFF